MRYLLPDYDIERFRQIDDLVRLCYFNPLNKLWGYPWRYLGQIGTTESGLTENNVAYIEAHSSPTSTLNGVCFYGSSGEDFTVWLNPDMRSGDLLFELTLIHELCHGYTGPVGHSQAWRKHFGVSVILYGELLNERFAQTQPEWQVKHTIRRYRNEEEDQDLSFTDHIQASDLELEQVEQEVERHMRHIVKDFRQLQEMRKGCHASTSNGTLTPAYLASLQRKAGTGFPSK